MITEIDIVKAVASKLKEQFQYEVYTGSTKEGFTKECFFVEIVSPSTGAVGSEMQEDEMSLRVTFFAANDALEKERWKIKQKMSKMFLFGLQVTEDFFISLEEPINFNFTSSGNLEMLMSLHFIQDLPEDDGEMIEELEVSYREE